MTSTEDKALALVREVLAERNLSDKRAVRREISPYTEALCRAIEQHEEDKAAHVDQLLVMDALTTTAETQREAAKQELNDFKQEVSDAVVEYTRGAHPQNLGQFIIPAPKPDPLVEVAVQCFGWCGEADAEKFRRKLDALGFEIREKSDG